MSTLQYSIAIKDNSATPQYFSIARIQITDNISGHEYLFPAPATYIRMVVVSVSDYRFVFRCGGDELMVPIGALNDINGTPPAGNNAATDYASLRTLINV